MPRSRSHRRRSHVRRTPVRKNSIRPTPVRKIPLLSIHRAVVRRSPVPRKSPVPRERRCSLSLARERLAKAGRIPSAAIQAPRRTIMANRPPRVAAPPLPSDAHQILEEREMQSYWPTQLFIGNLPSDAKCGDMQRFFERMALSDAVRVTIRDGYAVADFASKCDAEIALNANGAEYLGRELHVAPSLEELFDNSAPSGIESRLADDRDDRLEGVCDDTRIRTATAVSHGIWIRSV